MRLPSSDTSARLNPASLRRPSAFTPCRRRSLTTLVANRASILCCLGIFRSVEMASNVNGLSAAVNEKRDKSAYLGGSSCATDRRTDREDDYQGARAYPPPRTGQAGICARVLAPWSLPLSQPQGPADDRAGHRPWLGAFPRQAWRREAGREGLARLHRAQDT